MTLRWPTGWKRTPTWNRKQSQFSQARSAYRASEVLRQEVKRVGGEGAGLEISTDLEFRNDGLPRAQQKPGLDPGIAVYFRTKDGPVSFACDIYDRAEDNIYAIAKTIEAKRSIIRWGCATGAREFQGYAALPENIELSRAAMDPPVRQILGVRDDAQLEEVQTAYRKWVINAHPDRGGDPARFVRVKAMVERLVQELSPP